MAEGPLNEAMAAAEAGTPESVLMRVADALSAVARLLSERNSLRAQLEHASVHAHDYAEQVITLRAQRDELLAALRPLAAAGDAFEWVKKKSLDPNNVVLWGESGAYNDRTISVADAFSARAVIAKCEAVNAPK